MNQKYRVMIDFTGITRKQAAQIVAEQFGTNVSGSGDLYTVKDKFDRVWEFGINDNIRAECTNVPNPYYKTKMITPFCRRMDLSVIETLMTSLENAGAITNETCKLQICIDGTEYSDRSLQNLLNMIESKRELLSKSLAEFYEITDTIDITDRKNIMFNMFPADAAPERIKAYIQLSAAMCNKSVSQSNVSVKKPSMENEKYSLRGWLLQLGMMGDDYKETREILMENLSGNMAWRTPEQAAAARAKPQMQTQAEENSTDGCDTKQSDPNDCPDSEEQGSAMKMSM